MADGIERLKAALADRYAIEREIGQGGMAVVYLGRELKHDRRVAIKVLKPDIASSVSVDRFHREIEVEASLAHPHIVPLHDSGEIDGLPFCVMPYVEGETLDARIEREGALPVADAVRIARQVADALDYAHAHGVVHRDIKPRNILLTSKHAVVSDFGICRALEIAGGESLTSSGIVIGTPAYMSPEQGDPDSPIDGRGDIYSLGCMLYEMLIGEPPFTGPNAQVVISRHMSETVPSLSVARPGIPAEVEAIALKALAKTPADRYQTGAEMVGDLKTVEAESERGRTLPFGVRAPRRRLLATEPRLRLRRWFTGWHRVAVPVVLFFVIGTAIALWRMGLLEPSQAYGVEDPRRSYLVLPWADPDQSQEERELASQAAIQLTRQLRGWPIRAVPTFANVGRMWDLFGVREAIQLTPEQEFELARSHLVGSLIVLQVRLVRDSAHLEASLYDVAERREYREPIVSAEPSGEVGRLVAPVTANILGIRGIDPALETMVQESRDPLAHQDHDEGLDALNAWRLTDAEAHFRSAIATDPNFVAPRYYLALTLYWQTARDRERIIDLGPEIAGLNQAAVRLALERPVRPSLTDRLQAFHAFWEGDYDGARTGLDSILQDDPSDSEAWLLLGAVEFNDPWLSLDSLGQLRPRGNLNLARQSFDRTVEMSPDFQLGYGHLFDISRRVASDAVLRQCRAFQRPGGPPLPPYVTPEAGDQVAFCAATLDSIVWIARDQFDSDTRVRALERADELERRTSQGVRRWAEIQAVKPRPHEELADWLLWRRSLMGCSGDPAAIDSLTREALYERELALTLGSETPLAPEDLVRLAVLQLSVGKADSATALVDRALLKRRTDLQPRAPPAPMSAANIYLATGRPARALELLRPTWADNSFAANHPASGGTVFSGEVEHVLGPLRVFGPAGAVETGRPEIVRAAVELWAQPERAPSERAVLRWGSLLWQGLGPAVGLSEELRAVWFESWADEGIEIPPVWQGLIAADSDPTRAAEWIEPSLRSLESQNWTDAVSHFLVGLLAQRAGQDSIAVEQYGRAESCAVGLHRFDWGWGIRNLSTLFKARSLEALGDEEGAADARQNVASLWRNAEASMSLLVQEARQIP